MLEFAGNSQTRLQTFANQIFKRCDIQTTRKCDIQTIKISSQYHGGKTKQNCVIIVYGIDNSIIASGFDLYVEHIFKCIYSGLKYLANDKQ